MKEHYKIKQSVNELRKIDVKLNEGQENSFCLGEKYLKDKEKIEEQIALIESNYSIDDQRKILWYLESNLNQIKSEYKENVLDEFGDIELKRKDNNDQISKLSENFDFTKNQLESTKMEASKTDLSCSIYEAKEKKEELDKLKENSQQKLEYIRKRINEQKRKIME